MRKEKEWYALKIRKQGMSIYYRKKNRLIAFASSVFLASTLLVYSGFMKYSLSAPVFCFYLIILVFLLIMGSLVDSMHFFTDKNVIIRKKGLFPLIFKKNIPFSQVSRIRLEAGPAKKTAGRRIYSVFIELSGTDGFFAGSFRDKSFLISLFEQVGTVIVLED